MSLANSEVVRKARLHLTSYLLCFTKHAGEEQLPVGQRLRLSAALVQNTQMFLFPANLDKTSTLYKPSVSASQPQTKSTDRPSSLPKRFLASAAKMPHINNRWWNLNRPGSYILIATDGACRNNGRANAVAGCGVYWGPNDVDNKSFQLRDGFHPTNQRAELTAAICALSNFKTIFLNGEFTGRIDYVVIKTDSVYVAKSMTEWIVDWCENGYLDYSGRPICNKDLIQQLDSLCCVIYHDLGVQVCFWQVGRDDNTEADRLAKAAIR